MSKRAVLILLIVLISALLIVGIALQIEKRSTINKAELEQLLTKEIGYTVTIKQARLDWRGFYLVVALQNIIVTDPELKIPLAMAEQIDAYVDLWRSFKRQQLVIKRSQIDGLRLVIQKEKNNQLTVIGLTGEYVPGSIDIIKLFNAFQDQKEISLKNSDFHFQGEDGADLPLTQTDIKLINHGTSYTIKTSSAIASITQAQFIAEVHYQGALDNIRQSGGQFKFHGFGIDVAKILKFFPEVTDISSGIFQDVDISGAWKKGNLIAYKSNFVLEDLGVGNEMRTTLKGKVHYDKIKDNFYIDLYDSLIAWPSHYPQPIEVERLYGGISISYDKHLWSLQSSELSIELKDTSVPVHINFQAQKLIKHWEYNVELKSIDLQTALQYLPDSLPKPLSYWLTNTLVQGELSHVIVKNIDGENAFFMRFNDTILKYHAHWPAIEKLSGDLQWRGDDIEIRAYDASIFSQPIQQLSAHISGVNTNDVVVEINGKLLSTLDVGNRFLFQTPLNLGIAKQLNQLQPKGSMDFDLYLKIPITAKHNALNIKGNINVKDGSLVLKEENIAVTDLEGTISFTEQEVFAEKLQATILGKPALGKFQFGFKGENASIQFDSTIDSQTINELYPSLKQFIQDGTLHYHATIKVPFEQANNTKTIELVSTMKGIEIDLPAPFYKAANTEKQMIVIIAYDDQLKRVSLSYDNAFDAKLIFEGDQLARGHLVLGDSGKSGWNEAGKDLLVSGSLKDVNWQQWKNLLKNIEQSDAELPIHIDLMLENLELLGNKFQSVWLQFDSKNKKFYVDGSKIIGEIELFSKQKNNIVINLKYLNLHQNKDSDETQNVLSDFFNFVDFHCEDFYYDSKSFGDVKFHLIPKGTTYRIENFKIKNDSYSLEGQGEWQAADKSLFTAHVDVKDLGKTIEILGFGKSIQQGKGELNFQVAWPGSPFQLTLAKMEGRAELSAKNGQIIGVDPGLGRILGLLSLDNIQRRLRLDFNDIFKQGLLFDTFDANVIFEKKVAEIDNVLIDGPHASISLSGETRLDTKQLDLIMMVVPKMGSTIPLAAAIAAGNPAVGAAFWFFDRVSGSKMSQMTEHRYQVKGTWDTPQITSLSERVIQDKEQTTEKPK